MTSQKPRRITEKELIEISARKKRKTPYPAPTAPDLINHTVHYAGGTEFLRLLINFQPMYEKYGVKLTLQMQKADGSNGLTYKVDHYISRDEAAAHEIELEVTTSIFNPANHATVSITYLPVEEESSLPLELTLAN